MAHQDGRSDAYLEARAAALSWLRANWDPALTVRAWWARLADSGWASPPGRSRGSAGGSLTKLARSRLVQAGRDTGMSVPGARGMLQDPDVPGGDQVRHRALSSPGASIAGGTDEIQRGIVGERVLGLPKEPRTDRDIPFRDLTIGTQRG